MSLDSEDRNEKRLCASKNWKLPKSRQWNTDSVLLFRSHSVSSAKDIQTAKHWSFCEEGTEDDSQLRPNYRQKQDCLEDNFLSDPSSLLSSPGIC